MRDHWAEARFRSYGNICRPDRSREWYARKGFRPVCAGVPVIGVVCCCPDEDYTSRSCYLARRAFDEDRFQWGIVPWCKRLARRAAGPVRPATVLAMLDVLAGGLRFVR